MAVMAVLLTASIGMPGDGDHAMQATRLPMRITLAVAMMAAVGSLATGSAALRLARQPGVAIAALTLLLVVLLLSGLSLLGLMA
ncbi:putative membrane protein [Xanthomonas citri pv. mangiferaeindicae LMG 941]|nr:putative membrane protein [Xanthomonas citri pv. mangiferaeindicae]CCG35117.1 putative membrane protein [Xanthomonas citri pv. mangiferaeindicae LMG 941]